MSIISTWTNAFPMPLLGMADSQVSSVVSSVVEEPGYEVCLCDGCDFVETAFVSNGGTWWQNDWKSFLFKRTFSTDTITFSLLKDGVQQAVLNNDSYGTYYGFGSASLGNQDYKAFVIDWDLVQQAFGYGLYVVRTVKVSLGETYTYDSWKFNVVEYNPQRANGSVRVEWYQSGNILSGYDLTGIGWGQSLRIDGFFGFKTPELELTKYQDVGRKVKQIQAKINNTYSLDTQLLPSHIYEIINEDLILANNVYITDYNLMNHQLFRRFNGYCSNIKDVKHHELTKKSDFSYEFRPTIDNVLKRNIEGDYALLPTRQSSTVIVELKNLVYFFSFGINELETNEVELTADMEGTMTTLSQDGSSGTITININGGGYGAFVNPTTFSAGDTIQVKRTVGTAAGNVTMEGEYV